MKKFIQTQLNKLGYQIINKSTHAQCLKIRKWDFLKDIRIGTIIDIGANEGQFIEEIQNVFPEAEVYSFEPLNECYEKLVSIFKENKKIHPFNFALGRQEGEITFQRSSASPSSSVLKMTNLHKKLYPHTADLVEEKVKIKRLDDVLKDVKMQDHILLKIDVQGAEADVVKGAVEILKKVNVVVTEIGYATLYENQPLFKDIFTLLDSNNFIYIGNLEQFKNPRTDAPLFADAIFVKKEIYDMLYNL